MAYNPLIPNPTDLLSQSQADIKNNFIAIGAMLDPNTGEVKLPLILDVTADPATTATQVGLYSKLGLTSGAPELFFRRNNSGPIIDMTESSQIANGWTFLPSGLLMQWGTQATAGGPQMYNFPRAFPTACLQVVVGLLFSNADQNRAVQLVAFNATTYTVYSTQRTANVNANAAVTFWAIGN